MFTVFCSHWSTKDVFSLFQADSKGFLLYLTMLKSCWSSGVSHSDVHKPFAVIKSFKFSWREEKMFNGCEMH